MTDNFFWCINPNSGDTGGLLLADWVTPDTIKLNILNNMLPDPTNILSIIGTNIVSCTTATLANGQSYYNCVCKAGYSGSYCALPVCTSHCSYNGKCTAPNTC